MARSAGIFSRRWALSEERGDAFLDDADLQEELLFRWNGETIEDRAGRLPLEYFYPSTIGSALFFHEGFEAGEIAFSRALLAQIERPVILDVGANIGLHAVSWCAELADALCHAFEPIGRNRMLLERNVLANGLSDRIVVCPKAADRASGAASVLECADAAYSTLNPATTMPVVARYAVATTSIDDYVTAAGLEHVDLIKIDVEGYEDAVLAGATRTIAREAPCLFLEISVQSGSSDPEATIRRLVGLGYRPYVINDGIVTPYERHDELAYNYFFIHVERNVRVPVTNAEIAREEASYRSNVVRLQSRSLVRLRASVSEKDDEIGRLKSAADERLALLSRLESDLREALSAQPQLQVQLAERDQRLVSLEQRVAAMSVDDPATAATSARMLTELRRTVERRDAELGQLRAALAAQQGEIERLVQDAQDHHTLLQQLASVTAQLDIQRVAAEERAGVIERLMPAIEALEEQRTAASERAVVIETLQDAVEARDAEISRLTDSLKTVNFELSARDAVVDKLEEMARRHREESEGLRHVAEERQAVIAGLEALANERLDVIRSMHKA